MNAGGTWKRSRRSYFLPGLTGRVFRRISSSRSGGLARASILRKSWHALSVNARLTLCQCFLPLLRPTPSTTRAATMEPKF